MNKENWIKTERGRFICNKDNPYYFATTYLYVGNNLKKMIKFETPLNEKQFNNYFKIKDDVDLQ